MLKEIIGHKIKLLRIKKGLSQEQLADDCGLDRTYITYVENGKKNITVETLYKLTKALDISLSEFFLIDESKIQIKKKVKLDLSLSDLVVDKIYTNLELSSIFSCSTQGGMRVCKKNKTITLINQEYGKEKPYSDSKINADKTFVYTGMGLRGDQVVSYNNQNGKVAYSDSNGYTIYYFVGIGKNQYQYKGIAELYKDYYFTDEIDTDGNNRKVVKFPLKLV